MYTYMHMNIRGQAQSITQQCPSQMLAGKNKQSMQRNYSRCEQLNNISSSLRTERATSRLWKANFIELPSYVASFVYCFIFPCHVAPN